MFEDLSVNQLRAMLEEIHQERIGELDSGVLRCLYEEQQEIEDELEARAVVF